MEAVQNLLEDPGYIRDGWSGTATQLLHALNYYISDDDLKRSRAWPKAPNSLTRRMRRMAPALRSIGISYAEGEEGDGKRKVKTLRKIDDGRGGSQDSTNTLARDPEQITLGISPRAQGDAQHSPVDESDRGLREDDRVIESPYLPAETPSARAGGGEAADDYYETEAAGADSRPPQEDQDDSDQEEVGQEMSALEKLTQRGWSRSPELLALEHTEPPLASEEVERDPVAREILDRVTLYVPKCRVDMWMPTDTELLETWKKGGRGKRRKLTDLPETLEQARTRLIRMLSSLQTRRRYPDLEASSRYWQLRPGWMPNEFSCPRDGYLHVERWENEGDDEGLWVFIALRPGWQASEAYIEKRILEKLEKAEMFKKLGYEDDFDFDWDEE